MWSTSLSVLASGWVLFTPFLWEHSPARAVIAVAVGLVGLVLSAGAAFAPRLRDGVALAGLALALSSFFLWDGFATTVNGIASGVFLIVTGLLPFPRPVVQADPARVLVSTPPSEVVRPGRKAARGARRPAPAGAGHAGW